VCTFYKGSDTNTCGSGTDFGEKIVIDAVAKTLTATKDVMAGYEYFFCLSCYLHDTLTTDSIFSIKQQVGCLGYLELIPSFSETLTYQGDGDISQLKSYTVENFYTKTP